MSIGEAPSCPGPDPLPRPPRERLPAGSVDCHSHIFGPVDRYPYAAVRGYTPPDASLADYRRMLDTMGFTRAVVVQPSVLGTDNRATMDAVAAMGGAFRAVVVVDPGISDAELAALDAGGARGVRFNLNNPGGLSLEAVDAVARRIAPFGWHLQFFADLNARPELVEVMRRQPVPVVVDHMGHLRPERGLADPGAKALLGLLEEGRAWVKISGAYRCSSAPVPYQDTTAIARALVEAAPDRVVFGTDWPHPDYHRPMPNDGDLVDLLLDWVPDAALRRRILVDNPERLYRF
ncbi:MAG: amidohydrolase family protein [Alphaproteobacteria bacterium]|nr:amidohydrolase family protein [Alphaproteobacteria bacterium]